MRDDLIADELIVQPIEDELIVQLIAGDLVNELTERLLPALRSGFG